MLLGFASHDPSAGRVDGLEPVQHGELSDRDEIREEIGMTLAAMMPWAVSVFVHMGLIVLAFLLVWQTIVTEEPQQPAPQLVRTPDATIVHPDPIDQAEDPSEAEAAETFDPTVNLAA